MTFLTILAIALAGSGQSHAPYQISGKNGEHTYRIRFEQRPFTVQTRKLIWVDTRFVGKGAAKRLAAFPLGSRKSWNPEYSSIYPGFFYKGKAYAFHESDGREYDEVEGMSPFDAVKDTTELGKVSVWVDGTSLKVPKALYWDLLDAHPAPGYVKSSMNPKGDTLTVKLFGSDGAGSYVVQWEFRTSGRNGRSMLDPESQPWVGSP